MGATFAGFAQGISDGIEFYKIGDTENAKTLLDRNMSSASNMAEAYYYYGQIAFDEGNLSEAQSYYDKAVAANPSYPYSYVGQGAILLKNGNKGVAENLFKQARKLTKKNSKLEIAIARAYYAANPTAYDSQIKKCVKDAQKWNQKDPDSYNFEGDR
ncbi:MAG: tetratricopeptide repeat protein, partial [Muribaculaceae bacterium]|nr:tetratricopeptide repeat protein [Muribaculaceae bacterium]